MTPLARIAAYCRVSTQDQAEAGLSLEAQPVLCFKKLEEVFGPGKFICEVFADGGKSGGSGPAPWATELGRGGRPQLWNLIKRIRNKEFTHVIAFRGDRLYRNTACSLGFYSELLKPNGVKLIYVAENFDESAAGELVAGVAATFAAHYRRLSGENIRRTVQTRRDKGYYLGRAPYGWRHELPGEFRHERPNIVKVDAEAEVVIRIKNLYLSGHSAQGIARILNAEGVKARQSKRGWLDGTVYGILLNPVHAGLVRVNVSGETIQGLHYEDRLYDENTLRQIKARMDRNRTRLKGVAHSQAFRLFSGLLHCGACGARLTSAYSQTCGQYRCSANRSTGDSAHVYVNADYMERKTLEVLTRLSKEAATLAVADQAVERFVAGQDEVLKDEGKKIRKRLNELDDEGQRLTSSLMRGSIPEARAKRGFEVLEQQDMLLRARLCEIDQALAASESRVQLAKVARARLRDFPFLWDRMTDSEKRECVHTVIERMDAHVKDDRKWITYSFSTGHEPEEVELLRGAERFTKRRLDGPASLTPRELAALRHTLDGCDYNEVASRMGVSIQCAHGQLRSAAQKLGVMTAANAAESVRDMLLRIQNDLPLYGKYAGPRYEALPLLTTEYHVLRSMAEGHKESEVAIMSGMTAERVRIMYEQALKKLNARGPKEAMRKLKKLPELLPVTIRNRQRLS